jgi:hypothetical protein
MTYFFALKSFGNMIGHFCGGRLVDTYGVHGLHKICLYITIGLILFYTLYREEKSLNKTKYDNFFSEMNAVFKIF